MRVSVDEMRDLCKRILLSHELTEEEAKIVSDDYLDAEMRGKPSHGLKAFSVVVEDSKNRGKATVDMERGPVILYEGNGDIGHLVAHEAILWAEKSCQKHGIAVVGMRNIKRLVKKLKRSSKAIRLRYTCRYHDVVRQQYKAVFV